MSRVVRTGLLRCHVCPPEQVAPKKDGGLGLSHRQGQNLLIEFENGFGVTHRDREEISGELANTGAALDGHFAEPGVDDRGGTYLDLLAITFVRLGHTVILARIAQVPGTDTPSCVMFLLSDRPTSGKELRLWHGLPPVARTWR